MTAKGAPGDTPPPRDPRYPLGVAMILAAGFCLSLGGLILRHVETGDVWQISFYRSVTFFLTILAFLALRYRGRVAGPFLAVGPGGLMVSCFMGIGSALYLLAISLTTVANVMFILSTAPLLTAVLGRILLGERLRALTWGAMVLALSGIAIMVAGGLESGRLAGNLAALGTVFCFAGMVVTIRRAGPADMVPAICLGGLVGAAFSAALAGGLSISGHDLGLSVLLGSAQVGAGFLLITLGTRYVPAGEVALLAQSEIVLAPIWVWVFIDEVPSGPTLLGGAVVLTAVFGLALAQLRSNPASAA
jgi:drug/metabolite transporter (DMT)-like permease